MSVGRMDSTFFVSRGELLQWLNTVFQLNLTKVEQCANGAVYCQIIDACHPGAIAMKKVNWAARDEHQCIPNFKALQQAFDRCKIQRHIEVDKLIKGKYQDNLEMLQWIKTYFERSFPGGEYDALSKRAGDNLPEWARPAEGYAASRAALPPRAPGAAAAGGQAPPGGAAGRATGSRKLATPPATTESRRLGSAIPPEMELLKEEHERLREEVVDLKITVDGLETERDFYFQKLRDIEILCQALEANPDPNVTVGKFAEDVQRILYAKDDEDDAMDPEDRDA